MKFASFHQDIPKPLYIAEKIVSNDLLKSSLPIHNKASDDPNAAVRSFFSVKRQPKDVDVRFKRNMAEIEIRLLQLILDRIGERSMTRRLTRQDGRTE